MYRSNLPFEFDGDSLYSHLQENAPKPKKSGVGGRNDDFYVYIMGPYTAFDVTHVVDLNLEDLLDEPPERFQKFDNPTTTLERAQNRLYERLHEKRTVEGNVFDRRKHEEMKDVLEDVRDDLRANPGVRAFLATDIDIPTKHQAGKRTDGDVEESDYMTPIDQSVEFALLADAVVFLLDESGVNTGVASEVTGVLGECGLRKRGTKRPLKPRGRFRVYRSNVSSATVEEAAPAYGVQEYEYDDYDDLLSNVRAFVDTVDERSRGQGGAFPLLHRSEL